MDDGLIVEATGGGVERASAALGRGELVGMPTETVYGLAADALNERAVARVFEAKGRPRFDPLIVHVGDAGAAAGLVSEWPERARLLAERFWPGPLTLVLPKRGLVPDLVTAGLDSVAVRCPEHPVALGLIRAFGGPVAAPSANRFGGISPTAAEHVVSELGASVSLVLDGGPCGRGLESTVVGLTGERATLLRPGALAIELIEGVVGALERVAASDNPSRPQVSPGRMDRHYAPRTPMLTFGAAVPDREIIVRAAGGADVPVALMTLGPGHPAAGVYGWHEQVVLSETGDLTEVAAGLFAALRRLDEGSAGLIVAEHPIKASGLGPAIRDRLARGSMVQSF
ncbi:L-threonylcarbamoyladenylate synthase [Mucisphaera calidilacus]|uniref:Threonylcarbamoyl-AMP synthase n=1 Tax=Mucisphaera calidilacus TaxID=2527982 RepID=A0A518C0J6_9BACT|nr:L-threonylcarbamoyladenylate synthase [Mucisphaera calidilacus]QDU72752.1 Threonylcarbamoyl-AMP synthase [Mucisphaera calidilacus]